MPDDQATTPVPTGAHQGASESEPVRTGAHQPSIPVPTGAHRTIENPRAPSHFVAVATARERYSSAGFPRTEKAIRSYCHDGSLKFVTERGPNGHPKFWIDPLTIDEHHKELSQLYPVGESTPVPTGAHQGASESELVRTGAHQTSIPVPTGAHQQQLENEQGSIAIRSLSPQPTLEPAPADTLRNQHDPFLEPHPRLD